MPVQTDQLVEARRFAEASRHGVHRVDGAAADGFLNAVPQFLEAQAEQHGRRPIRRHGGSAGIVQVVWDRQQKQMQGMALYALAAKHQLAKQLGLRAHLNAKRVLRGFERGESVGHRTDGTDPGKNGRHLVVALAMDQRLQQARAFEDVEMHVLHHVAFQFDSDAAVALHAGQMLDPNGAHDATPWGAKVRSRAAISWRAKPRCSNSANRLAELASSTGPRQPTHAMRSSGHRAPQPATVRGPQQSSPRSVSRQLFSRMRHSVQTGYSRASGALPFSRAAMAATNSSDRK